MNGLVATAKKCYVYSDRLLCVFQEDDVASVNIFFFFFFNGLLVCVFVLFFVFFPAAFLFSSSCIVLTVHKS